MKRSPLRRKTPMPRQTKPLRRTKLAPVSKKKRAQDAKQKSSLAEYRRLFPKCQRCGWRDGTDIHEILSGSFRLVAREHRSCLLHLCRVCHDATQAEPRARQLAIKATTDPLGFDLIEVNAILGCPTAVTMAEVDEEISKFNQSLTAGIPVDE